MYIGNKGLTQASGRIKFEGASQEYEFSSEESEGKETNREVEDDPPDSSSPEGRVKFEGASQGYEFSSEQSEGEETNREVEDDPPDSSSPEGRVKFEGASQGYEFSSIGQLEHRYCSVLFLVRNTSPYIILSPLFLLLYGLVRVPLIPIVFLPFRLLT
jgi:hypothetical protein